MAQETTLVTYKYDKEGVVRRSRGSLSGTYTAATVNSATAVSTTAAGGGIANARAVNDVLIASGVLTLTLGFVPSHVLMQNVTARTSVEWYAGMNFGDTLTTDVNGVKALSTANIMEVDVSTGVVTFTFSGQLTDNETLVWIAED